MLVVEFLGDGQQSKFPEHWKSLLLHGMQGKVTITFGQVPRFPKFQIILSEKKKLQTCTQLHLNIPRTSKNVCHLFIFAPR